MRGFNKVILMGNVTRDPELEYLPSQTAVVNFGLAMNRKWRDGQGQDREEVCFVDCAAFGKSAEVINQYCSKGKQLFIEGRLKFEQWDDKQGGGKRSKLKVVVENFQLLGDGGGGQQRQGGRSDYQGDAGGSYGADNPSEYREDDIPF